LIVSSPSTTPPIIKSAMMCNGNQYLQKYLFMQFFQNSVQLKLMLRQFHGDGDQSYNY
jgi:hypothetical protein